MQKFIVNTAAFLLAAVLFTPIHACALSAKSAVVMEPLSGRLLKSKNADELGLIASTTKIMTALLVCERCNVLDQMRIPGEAVGIEGSSMYLREGEILSIQELLYGLMLSSGNDAATALALYCNGSIEEFACQMNDKARILGMKNTHFQNPHGLDAENHYSTARDLGILASYAMQNPVFQKTVATKTIQAGNRFLRNHNKLLWLYPNADGVKTGYTKSAGRILVSSAVKDGRRLIGVTIHDPDDWKDHIDMITRCFQTFRVQRIVTKGDCVGYREIAGGEKEMVSVLASENFLYPVATDETVLLQLPEPYFVYAPISEGADAGYAYVLIAGKAIGKFPVHYGGTVEFSSKKTSRLFSGW